jgi:hypothetical protein
LPSGPRCTVCDHPERKAIEVALAVSSVRDIAGRFGLSKSAVHGHKQRHLKPAAARAIARREELGPAALVEKLVGYLEEAENGIEIAKTAKDLQGLARCIKEARETAVYIGKTIGLWSDRPQIVNDNRRQTIAIGQLSLDELRNLARLAPANASGASENGA